MGQIAATPCFRGENWPGRSTRVIARVIGELVDLAEKAALFVGILLAG